MRWVVGLGNPGPAYAGTRHNVGFEVLERLARGHGPWRTREFQDARILDRDWQGRPVGLLFPLAWMNQAGPVVRRVVGEGPGPFPVLVVCDDLALEPGALRIRARGSSGGHRGLQSILDALGTDEIPRLRVGIGGAPAEEWREHVLAPIPAGDRSRLDPVIEAAAGASWDFLQGEEAQALAARWNRRSPPA
jgi:PTH1 family peptidyl-tRNA hydrolase